MPTFWRPTNYRMLLIRVKLNKHPVSYIEGYFSAFSIRQTFHATLSLEEIVFLVVVEPDRAAAIE